MKNSKTTEEKQIKKQFNWIIGILYGITFVTYIYLNFGIYTHYNFLTQIKNESLEKVAKGSLINTKTEALKADIEVFYMDNSQVQFEHIREEVKELNQEILSYYRSLRNIQLEKTFQNNIKLWEEIKRHIFRIELNDVAVFKELNGEIDLFNKNLVKINWYVKNELELSIEKLLNFNLFGFIVVSFELLFMLFFLFISHRKMFAGITKNFKLLEEKNIQIISQSKMAAIGELAGGIAHEVNNPLQIVHGLNSTIRKKIKKENFDKKLVLEDLDKSIDTIERIARIIKGVKRMSYEGSEIDVQAFKVEDVVNNIISLIKEGFNSKGIEIKHEEAGSLENIYVEADEVSISQVFMNIISNAKYVVLEQEEKWIQVLTYNKENFIYFEISNSGDKIPSEVAARIFEPYFTTKKIGQGTGLGLSISKDIMMKYKGDLYLKESCLHTTFVIKLPCVEKKSENQLAS